MHRSSSRSPARMSPKSFSCATFPVGSAFPPPRNVCKSTRSSSRQTRLMRRRTRHYWLRVGAVAGIVLIFVFLAGIQLFRTYRENSHDHHIRAAALRYGVDPTLIKAVIWRESRFDPKAHGKANEIGLMQIREAAAEEWAKAEGIPFFSHQH